MTKTARRKTLLLLACVLIGVMVISAGLPQLRLQPGQPLPFLGYSTGINPRPENPPASLITTDTFLKALLGVLFTLCLPLLIYGLVKKSPWQRILRYTIMITVVTIAGLALLTLLVNTYGTRAEPMPEQATPSPVLPAASTPLGSPPSWLVLLVFSVIAVLLAVLGIWVIYSTTHGSAEKNRVAEEAEKAVDALKAGANLKDVIMRCYLQMSLALQQEQGIEREEAMTAREFERLLEDRGIPHDPVHDLTRLFEAVRYGRRQPSHQDEQTAFNCLNAIILYSHSEKPADENA